MQVDEPLSGFGHVVPGAGVAGGARDSRAQLVVLLGAWAYIGDGEEKWFSIRTGGFRLGQMSSGRGNERCVSG